MPTTSVYLSEYNNVMDAKLTLRLNESVIERAKKYASNK